MERKLLPNNTTLARLRGLLRKARKEVEAKEAVYVELMLWDYGHSVEESIGVYRSGTGEGTSKFETLKEAEKFIEGWKEEADGNSAETTI